MPKLLRAFVRFLTIAFAIAMASSATAPARPKAPPTTADNLDMRHWDIDGVRRYALVHIPREARLSPTPIVLAFHGHGGTAKDAAKDFEIHKYWPQAIVVYMKGLPSAASNDPKGEKSGWQYHPGDNDDRDVKFFDTVLADLRKSLKVDDKRIYVLGFSNGGGFTYVLWSMRGDQVSAVVSCAMQAPKKLISTFQPKPLLQIAGSQDKLQSVADQQKTVLAVAKLNGCGEGRQWGKRPNCILYPSTAGAPVVFLVHSGGHEVPKEAVPAILTFLKGETQSSANGNPVVGNWHLNQPSVGESNLRITERAGKLEVQEMGNGNAKSTLASCKDGLLVIHWEVSDDLRGYWVLNLNEEHTKGTGKAVFIRFKDFEPGNLREIAGRKVRVVEGVTIERFNSTEP
jgi:polyhydroxybutyrate depolymerase